MKKWMPEMICGLLILLLVYTATSKLFGYEQFSMQLSSSPWLASYAGIIAWLVPAAELVIAAMLTVVTTRKIGLYASLLLLLVFTLYIAGMLLSGTPLPCSCGGVVNELTWGQHLVFNLFFIFLSIAGIGLMKKPNQSYDTKNISYE